MRLSRTRAVTLGLGPLSLLMALATTARADDPQPVTAFSYFDELQIQTNLSWITDGADKRNVELVLHKDGKAELRFGSTAPSVTDGSLPRDGTPLTKDSFPKADRTLDVSQTDLKAEKLQPCPLETDDEINEALVFEHPGDTFFLDMKLGADKFHAEEVVSDIDAWYGQDNGYGYTSFRWEIVHFCGKVIAAMLKGNAPASNPSGGIAPAIDGIAQGKTPAPTNAQEAPVKDPKATTAGCAVPTEKATGPKRATLELGSQGASVLELQGLLVKYGYGPISVDGKPDGIFGWRTNGAIVAFQTNNNLHTDGIVGKDTWKALLDKGSVKRGPLSAPGGED